MLRTLTIENFGIIERAELQWEKGFSVLTGESGAGKTMILDALACALGERWDVRSMGAFGERCWIEALFELESRHPIWETLEPWGITADDYLMVSREIKGERSLFRIQAQAAPAQAVRSIRDDLIAMTGQHAAQRLLHSERLRAWLDQFGGLREWVESAAKAYALWQDLLARQEALERELPGAERVREIEETLAELQALDLTAGEDDAVHTELTRLRSGQKLQEAYRAVRQQLDGEESPGVLAQVEEVRRQLEAMSRYAPEAEGTGRLVEEAALLLTEAVDQLGRWWSALEWDERRLEWLESRSDALARIKRRFGPTLEEVLATLSQLEAELDRHGSALLDLEGIKQRLSQAKTQWREQAEALSRGRARAAEEASRLVSERLAELEMAGTTVQFVLSAQTPSASGCDRLEGWLRVGEGEPKPVEKVASGGELARITLAMTSLVRDQWAPAFLFDEVDAGLGGVAAMRVGELLRQLGETAQVLAVSHQPTVAAQARWHWVVQKDGRDRLPRAVVKTAVGEERVAEIARMLSGRQDSVALSHARQLLIEGEPGGQAAL